MDKKQENDAKAGSSMIHQKTNEDFNKIKPKPDDPGFKEPIKDPAIPVIEDGEELSHEEGMEKTKAENEEKINSTIY